MTFDDWCVRWHIPEQALNELKHLSHPAIISDTNDFVSEAGVQAKLRTEAVCYGGTLWRNNNGAATTDDGRHIRFGLGNDSAKLNAVWKSSDLIGITPMQSTAAGQVFGVFTAIEVKKPGWKFTWTEREKAQMAMINQVRALGGIGGFAQSVEDYRSLINVT